MTPRDALEVVRHRANVTGDDILPEVRQAIATLSALVERAGEPVGTLTLGKYESEFSFPPTRKLSIKELHRRYGYGAFPVYIALPPAAPGASHESR